MTRQIPWLRVFVEGVVIVGSILLAFGLQAWWEGRGEAETQRTVLSALRSDFDSVAVDLERVRSSHQRFQAAAERLIEMARAGAIPQTSAQEVDSLLTQVFEMQTFDPSTGALEALINSGDLGVVGDATLTGELTAWPALIVDLREQEELQAYNGRKYNEVLQSHGINTNDLVVGDTTVPWEAKRTDAYRLLSDPELEGIIGERWFSYRALISDLDGIAAKVDLIRSLIDQKLTEGR